MRRRDPGQRRGQHRTRRGTADGAPHVVTVRTPDARLVWYKEIAARSRQRIAAMGVFDNWHGILVRDDYAGWHQFDDRSPESSNAEPTSSDTCRACSTSTPRCSNGPARSRKRYVMRRN